MTKDIVYYVDEKGMLRVSAVCPIEKKLFTMPIKNWKYDGEQKELQENYIYLRFMALSKSGSSIYFDYAHIHKCPLCDNSHDGAIVSDVLSTKRKEYRFGPLDDFNEVGLA
jgi:hypothetical protein